MKQPEPEKNMELSSQITLREFEFFDWTAVQEYASDKDVTKFMIWGPNNEQSTKQFLREAIARNQEIPRRSYEYAIVLSDDLIGGCTLTLLHHEDRMAEVGYVLNKAYWGNGYALQALQLLLKLAFDKLALHRVIASCNAVNKQSERVMQKAGMRKEGHFLRDCFIKGKWRDTLLYAILEDEYRHNLK